QRAAVQAHAEYKAYLELHGIDPASVRNGIYFEERHPGKGKNPVYGQTARVHYALYLMDGTQVEDTRRNHIPFDFTVGTTTVIPGLNEAVLRMKKGGSAKVIIPAHLAHGAKAVPPVIPPHAVLIYE